MTKGKRGITAFLVGIFLPFLLCAACDPADLTVDCTAPQAPPNTTLVASFEGKWSLAEITDESGEKIPSLTSKIGDYINAEMNFTPRNTPLPWEIQHGSVFRPRIRAKIAFTPKVFQCKGLPLMLWFEDGESLSLGNFSCVDGRLSTGTDDTDLAVQERREQDLAKLIVAHHLTAVTQGRAAVTIEHDSQDGYVKFQQEINPRKNAAYFKRAHQKWNQTLKKGTHGLQLHFES
ncbi:hypothetical protein FAI40_04540 [Acetobacteraceae bacterium]|nr:hypothetical protein FAI40_04540 [Acetobacteraceae bacterium]